MARPTAKPIGLVSYERDIYFATFKLLKQRFSDQEVSELCEWIKGKLPLKYRSLWGVEVWQYIQQKKHLEDRSAQNSPFQASEATSPFTPTQGGAQVAPSQPTPMALFQDSPSTPIYGQTEAPHPNEDFGGSVPEPAFLKNLY